LASETRNLPRPLLYNYAAHIDGWSAVEELIAILPRPYSLALREYLGALRRFGRHDFTTALLEALERGEPFNVSGLALDEIQDNSLLMWRAVMKLFPDVEHIAFAGDVNQTIYTSLHGSDPQLALKLMKAVEEAGGEVKYLTQSRRVPAPIAEYAKRVIEKARWHVEDSWAGREAEGGVYKIAFNETVEKMKKLHSLGNKIFVLTATNEAAVEVGIELLTHGLLPAGIKDMPSKLCRYYGALVNYACLEERGERPLDKAEENIQRLRVVYGRLKEQTSYKTLVERLGVCCLLKAAVGKLCGGRLKCEDYDYKPRLYVDTVYTVKGLEADVVFIINHRAELTREEAARLTYVAVTRSRGDVYVVGPAGWAVTP
jgi:superfamily I DNA/RNA helicase